MPITDDAARDYLVRGIAAAIFSVQGVTVLLGYGGLQYVVARRTQKAVLSTDRRRVCVTAEPQGSCDGRRRASDWVMSPSTKEMNLLASPTRGRLLNMT